MNPIVSMPDVYIPPFGTPLYWMDETSGVLPKAMNDLVWHMADSRKPAPNEEQLKVVIAYLIYAINAPCWKSYGSIEREDDDLSELRQRAIEIKTIEDISRWLNDCLKLGLDLI